MTRADIVAAGLLALVLVWVLCFLAFEGFGFA
jgi:hypothetical protein